MFDEMVYSRPHVCPSRAIAEISRFSIDVHNMKPLARLADKYIIDALLRDIRVVSDLRDN